MSDQLQRVSARFEGRVQGVGFRYSTVEIARSHDVAGYVKNMPDGSVSVVAEGEEQPLLQFIHAIEGSHLERYIRHSSMHWSSASGNFRTFEIGY